MTTPDFVRIGSGTFSSIYSVSSSKVLGLNVDEELILKRNFTNKITSLMSNTREMDILRRLNHPFVVKLRHMLHSTALNAGTAFSPVNSRPHRVHDREDEVHFVFPKAESDIHQHFQKNQPSPRIIQLFACQLLLGIEYMHSQQIIHRDLKGTNILYYPSKPDSELATTYNQLVSERPYYGTLVIADFGMAKFQTLQESMTPGVTTSWFRSPEMCMDKPYSYPTDIWSAGCVIYEMIATRSTFSIPANSPNENVAILNSILCKHPYITPENYREASQARQGIFCRKNFSSFLESTFLTPNSIKIFVDGISTTTDILEDLLTRLLRWNPDERMTATQALDHPFFANLRSYISHYRGMAFSLHHSITPIVISKERNWLADYIYTIYHDRHNFPHLNERMLFQVVDIFYRYLEYLRLNSKVASNSIESSERGKYLSRSSTNYILKVITYMVIQYFSTIQPPTPISLMNLGATPIEQIGSTEKFLLINVLDLTIYRPTALEEADKYNLILGGLDKYGLLMFLCCNNNYADKSAGDLLRIYLARKDRVYQALYNAYTSGNRKMHEQQAFAIICE